MINRQQRRAKAATAKRIELPQDIIDRLAAVRINDEQVQHHYYYAAKEGATAEEFLAKLTSDLEALENNAREIKEEQTKQRQIDDAREFQANRIAIAGMALPAIIAAADDKANITDIARLALDMADRVLDIAEVTKDPILNV